jgi:hypothetical protein
MTRSSQSPNGYCDAVPYQPSFGSWRGGSRCGSKFECELPTETGVGSQGMTAEDWSGFATQFEFSEDVAAADWLRKRVVDSGVGWSMMPAGFEAYVQVLHPALGSDGSEVSWREIADLVGLPLLPGVWFEDLEERAPADRLQRPWVQQPSVGEVPEAVLDAMMPILVGQTTTREGWFAVWEGSDLGDGHLVSVAWHVDDPPRPGTPSRYRSRSTLPRSVLEGPKLRLPYRDYLMLTGPLNAVGKLGVWAAWDPGDSRHFHRITPNLWWPEDRAWCAANEIDASWTCIGGTRQLVQEVLSAPGLETLELDPELQHSPYKYSA